MPNARATTCNRNAASLLARPEALHSAAEACFRETTTIGMRRQQVDRFILERAQCRFGTPERMLEVKQVQRPQGASTKLESRDLRYVTGHAERERLRKLALDMAGSAGDTEDD